MLDAGYDSERAHDLARREMGIRSIIPPDTGRPLKSGALPGGRWRWVMKRLMATKESRRQCKYNLRYQAETVNSMMKRNLGSALAGKTARSREHDMLLKVLTHDVMVLRRGSRQSSSDPVLAAERVLMRTWSAMGVSAPTFSLGLAQ